jgi:hypothetical protein
MHRYPDSQRQQIQRPLVATELASSFTDLPMCTTSLKELYGPAIAMLHLDAALIFVLTKWWTPASKAISRSHVSADGMSKIRNVFPR